MVPMALKGPVGEQLSMLMPAKDIMGRILDSNDIRPIDSRKPNGGRMPGLEGMRTRKLAESKRPEGEGHGSGVYDSLASRGYDGDPLRVRHTSGIQGEKWGGELAIQDGNHRLVASADLGLEVPVSHYDMESSRIEGEANERMLAGGGSHDVRLGSMRATKPPTKPPPSDDGSDSGDGGSGMRYV